jgi:ankyrin repeat protein/Zn finger protein HypA/HybF involved in hydrogenase expression
MRSVVLGLAALGLFSGAALAQGEAPRAEPASEQIEAPSDARAVDDFIAAAEQGRLDLVERHVAAGIDVNAQAQHGVRTTALLAALARIQPEIAAYLLSHGADPNLANADGVTPLSLAVRASAFDDRWRPGYRELVETLIAGGAKVDARDVGGHTPLMEAVFVGNVEAASMLLDAGADLEQRNAAGATALLLASSSWARVASALLERGADPNVVDAGGRTPLMQAVRHGWLTVVEPALMDGYAEYIRQLLDAGADPNATDHEGRTALAEAATNGDLETAELLLSRGARPTSIAWGSAVDHESGAVVRALIEHGHPLSGRQRFEYATSRIALALAWMFPLLILGTIVALWAYADRVRKRPSPPRHDAAHGDQLPHLAPIQCEQCGGGVPLRLDDMRCPKCSTPASAPEDYRETSKARATAEAALAAAVVQWRRATVITSAPVRWFFWSLGLAWLSIVNIGIFNAIGSALFEGHPLLFVSGLLGAVGVPVFSMTYAAYLGDVRRRLPVVPEIGAHVAERAVSDCPTCGGAVAHERGQLVAACGYCGSEIYRVKLARRSKIAAQSDEAKASLSLYEAMVEVDALRRQLLENLLMAPVVLPVLLYMAPVATILVLVLLALLGRC